MIYKIYFLLNLPFIILFNILSLPLNQAKYLPIILICKNWPSVLLDVIRKRGKIIIDSENIRFHMIELGRSYYFYEKNGIYYRNNGTIIFRGRCIITNSSVIDVKTNSTLEFGDNFGASIIKILCTNKITFGKDCLIGINCTFMDSDFHAILDIVAKQYIKSSNPIFIGNNNWIGYCTTILKGTKTPDNCIVRALSLLDRKYRIEEFSIIGTDFKTVCLGKDYIHDPFDDSVIKHSTEKLSDEEIQQKLDRLNYSHNENIRKTLLM